jgi:hypothetical protein
LHKSIDNASSNDPCRVSVHQAGISQVKRPLVLAGNKPWNLARRFPEVERDDRRDVWIDGGRNGSRVTAVGHALERAHDGEGSSRQSCDRATHLGCAWPRELTEKRIRRGTFGSVKELVAAIREYLDHNNQQPRPFVWKASTERILEEVARCKAIYETLH